MQYKEEKKKLLDTIYSYRKAQLLYIAAKLQISDLLKMGPTNTDELAKTTKTNHDAFYRVMRALSNIGVYKENEGKIFELTPTAELLKQDHPNSIRLEVIMRMEEYNWRPWGELLFSVKTGKSAFNKVFEMNLFEYLSKKPECSKQFNEVMGNYSHRDACNLIEEYNFSPFQTIVDIGGGYGILINEILKRYENINGIVFDLPHVIKEARQNLNNNKTTNRIKTIGGNFFKDPIPKECDLYILKKIIHDWDDEHANIILENCYDAASINSRILLVESVIGDDNPSAFINDIHMLVQTIGGRERTGDEYVNLLNRAGYKINKITKSFVEGIKE